MSSDRLPRSDGRRRTYDAGGIGIAVRPHQAVTAGGVIERGVAPGARAGNRVTVDIARQPPRSGADGGNRGTSPAISGRRAR